MSNHQHQLILNRKKTKTWPKMWKDQYTFLFVYFWNIICNQFLSDLHCMFTQSHHSPETFEATYQGAHWQHNITCHYKQIYKLLLNILQYMYMYTVIISTCHDFAKIETLILYYINLAKLWYFTNLDFLEIRGFPLLNHHLGWGRVRSLEFDQINNLCFSFLWKNGVLFTPILPNPVLGSHPTCLKILQSQPPRWAFSVDYLEDHPMTCKCLMTMIGKFQK